MQCQDELSRSQPPGLASSIANNPLLSGWTTSPGLPTLSFTCVCAPDQGLSTLPILHTGLPLPAACFAGPCFAVIPWLSLRLVIKLCVPCQCRPCTHRFNCCAVEHQAYARATRAIAHAGSSGRPGRILQTLGSGSPVAHPPRRRAFAIIVGRNQEDLRRTDRLFQLRPVVAWRAPCWACC